MTVILIDTSFASEHSSYSCQEALGFKAILLWHPRMTLSSSEPSYSSIYYVFIIQWERLQDCHYWWKATVSKPDTDGNINCPKIIFSELTTIWVRVSVLELEKSIWIHLLIPWAKYWTNKVTSILPHKIMSEDDTQVCFEIKFNFN